jgi:hypothetical protein
VFFKKDQLAISSEQDYFILVASIAEDVGVK